jgi:phosphatidate cytidylyltransferase
MSRTSTGKSRFRQKDFWIRTISALILIPFVLTCAILGEGWFLALVIVATAAMGREWVRMSDHKAKGMAYALGIIGLNIPVYFASNAHWLWALLALVAVTIVAAIERAGRGEPWRAVVGLLYIGLAVLAILFLRSGPEGLLRILYLFAVVWAADSAAYLVGSQVRGPKLWPEISPNKTWSGFFGGLFAGTLAGSLTFYFAGYGLAFGLVLLSMVLAVISVGGDLLSSWLKRRFGVKDTGTSIPGHGGVLDRLDALLAASMALAAYMIVTSGTLI